MANCHENSISALFNGRSFKCRRKGMNHTILLEADSAMMQLLRLFASKPQRAHKPQSKQRMVQQQTAVDMAVPQQQQRQPQPQRQNRQNQHQQQQGRGPSPPTSSCNTQAAGSSRSSSSGNQHGGSLLRPPPLVLPSMSAAAAAAAPVLGRVKPSSDAAAAAAAAILQALQPEAAAAAAAQEPRSPARLLRHRRRRAVAHPATTTTTSSSNEAHAMQQQQQQQAADTTAHHQQQQQQLPQPKPHALPWELVDALPPPAANSPLSLEALAAGGIGAYMAYMAAARLGKPTVFDLGVCREQGHAARKHLLQREQLLQLLAQELRQTSSSRGSSGDTAAAAAADEQQQQQQDVGQPTDEQLEDLSEQQLESVAAAAAASGRPLLREVTADDVAECLVDYFVFSRCIQVLLLQRQHRQALQEKHHTLLQQHEEQQQQGHGGAAPVTLLSDEELSGVKVWDAFFDASLQSYHSYLKAAAAGHPSVYTNATAFFDGQQQHQHQQQHQQKQQQQRRQKALERFQGACSAVAREAHILGILPTKELRQPGHLTKLQLVQLALMAGEGTAEGVVQALNDFGAAKRMAFREVLEELLTAAGAEAAGSMGRF